LNRRGRTKKDIEKEVKKLQKKIEKLKLKGALLDSLLENIPDLIYFKDKESRFVEVSKSKAEQVSLERAEIMGKTDFDYFTEEHARPAYEDEQEIIKTGKPILNKVEKETHPDGRITWVSTTKVPRYNDQGEIMGILGISRDVTRLKTLELEKEKKLKAQREELEILSTPVVDVWDGILAVPVLGILDSDRASRISEALLNRIVETRAWAAIVDISGISAVDSAVADLLIRTAQAVKFVGAKVVLTGVGTEIAQTIADLGIDMKGLKTMSTLKDGLKYVINRKKEISLDG
jgi:rsbT co-antagonist protein RsbR